MKKPVHPGLILKKDVIEELGLMVMCQSHLK